MFQTNQKKLWWALAACATLGLTGCIDPFASTPNPALGVTRVMAVDQNAAGRPLILESPTDPGNIVLDNVPRHNSRIYVVFTKPVDGTSLTQTTTQLLDPTSYPVFCVPATNVTVTETKAGSTTANPIAAEVCYDPTLPGVVVQPAVNTCFGPQPWARNKRELGLGGTSDLTAPRNTFENFPQFDTGSTYVVSATGVKAYDGKTMDLKVTINVAGSLAAVSYDPDVNSKAIVINTAFTLAGLQDPSTWTDTIVASAATPATVTGVPVGILNADTKLYTNATNYEYFGTAEFGTNLRISLNDMICAARKQNRAGFCDPSGSSTGPNSRIHMNIGTDLVGYSAISDYGVIGDPRVYYAAPYLPLESDQEYLVTIDGDPNVANPALTAVPGNPDPAIAKPRNLAPIYAKFRSAKVSPPQTLWGNPAPLTPNTDPATYAYPSTSPDLQMNWMGMLAVGVATSDKVQTDVGGNPIATQLGVYDAAGNPIAGLTTDNVFGTRTFYGGSYMGISGYGDNRNRFILFGANNATTGGMFVDGVTSQPKLNLFPGATYTVRAKGLKALDGTPFTDLEYQFKTMPLGYDVALPGYSDLNNTTPGGGSTFKPGVGNTNLINRQMENSFYLVNIPADIAIATPATSVVQVDDGAFTTMTLQFFQLPAGASVKLTRVSDGADIPIKAGAARYIDKSNANAALKPFELPSDFYAANFSLGYPGSQIGLQPVSRLDFATQYKADITGLTATLPDGTSAAVPAISYTFTTRGFNAYVYDRAGYNRQGSETRKVQLAGGANNVVVSPAKDAAGVDIPLRTGSGSLSSTVNPLIVITSGLVDTTDPATFPHAETGDLTGNAVRLIDNGGGGGAGTDVPIRVEWFRKDGVAAYSATNTRLFAVRPLSALPAGRAFTLLITNKLLDKVSQTPVNRVSVTFVTASQYDAGGVLQACSP